MKQIEICVLLVFVACTPRSKMYTIVQQRHRDASTPVVAPEPNKTITKDIQPLVIRRDGDKLTPPTPLEGELIQTGGSVALLARELTIDLGLKGNNIAQIIGIQKYVFQHWHYIHDPARSKDTWRSADATIALRYKTKFPGDCDDFAILMASLARQIGLRSRMVGGFSNNQGHAFAEFLVPKAEYENYLLNKMDFRRDEYGLWASLDWFNGFEHERFLSDIRIMEQ